MSDNVGRVWRGYQIRRTIYIIAEHPMYGMHALTTHQMAGWGKTPCRSGSSEGCVGWLVRPHALRMHSFSVLGITCYYMLWPLLLLHRIKPSFLPRSHRWSCLLFSFPFVTIFNNRQILPFPFCLVFLSLVQSNALVDSTVQTFLSTKLFSPTL